MSGGGRGTVTATLWLRLAYRSSVYLLSLLPLCPLCLAWLPVIGRKLRSGWGVCPEPGEGGVGFVGLKGG